MTQVLIAEDEDDIRQVLVAALSDAGFEVVEAKTEALAASISLNFARTRHPGLPVLFVMNRPGEIIHMAGFGATIRGAARCTC